MKTTNISLQRLRGEEHFQFGEDVIALLTSANVEPKVATQANAFKAIHREEDTVLEQIRKSALTTRIAEADAARDEVFYGLVGQINSLAHHFTNDIRQAAIQLASLPMKTYGPVATLNYAEQTAKIYNLIQELRENYAEEILTLGLTNWLNELGRLNNAVASFMRQRDIETAGRTHLVMKEVRLRADEAYRTVVDAVESLAVVAAMGLGGDDDENIGTPALYESFISGLNAIIDRYNNTLAARRGRAKAKKENEEEIV